MVASPKILAIDSGMKKIGLALSDLSSTVAHEINSLAFDNEFWNKLQEIVINENVVEIVVGIPRGFHGDTDQTRWARSFIAELQSKISLPIHEWSELFTTKMVKEQRKGLAKKYRKKADDSEAAAILLMDYLGSRRQLS
ncbi:MAG: Holliday junction resolvase RuvX [Patescibacteria group bacterium]|nr:Holliday junction resolvase RuvX [Patescibacteria group bacterium]